MRLWVSCLFNPSVLLYNSVFFIVNGVQYSNCSNGAIRLTGGSNGYEGRVEICANGVWGSFCDRYWDSSVASAVCQQLGYEGQYGLDSLRPPNVNYRFFIYNQFLFWSWD